MKYWIIALFILSLSWLLPVEASEETTQVAQETTEASESVTDYAQLQEEYLSYLKNKELSDEYRVSLWEYKVEDQHKLLKLFQIWKEEFWNDIDKMEKHLFALGLFDFSQEVIDESWEAGSVIEDLQDDVSSFSWGELEMILTLIAKQADHYEYEMSDEDKAELARLQANIDKLKSDRSQSERNTAQSERNTAQSKKDTERFNRLNKLWTKIKLANKSKSKRGRSQNNPNHWIKRINTKGKPELPKE